MFQPQFIRPLLFGLSGIMMTLWKYLMKKQEYGQVSLEWQDSHSHTSSLDTHFAILQIQNNQVQLVFGDLQCTEKSIKIVHCLPPTQFGYNYLWTRYPLATTRMWNLLSIFDPPAYTCFFTSLVLTVVFMKIYSYLGSRLGLDQVTEDFILIPIGYIHNLSRRPFSDCT